MVEAIIFDMDGVLFDTEKYYYDRRASFLAQREFQSTIYPRLSL